jgi:hypothetical protein
LGDSAATSGTAVVLEAGWAGASGRLACESGAVVPVSAGWLGLGERRSTELSGKATGPKVGANCVGSAVSTAVACGSMWAVASVCTVWVPVALAAMGSKMSGPVACMGALAMAASGVPSLAGGAWTCAVSSSACGLRKLLGDA